MSESFVDLSYRGLALGKRIKLTQVRAAAGYLEMPTPMPVGTTIGIATEDGVVFEATVTLVHEQVTGADRTPGMQVTPTLDNDAARAWWKSLADGVVTVAPRRSDEDDASELVDDGRSTAVVPVVEEPGPDRTVTMDAVDLEALGLEPEPDTGKKKKKKR